MDFYLHLEAKAQDAPAVLAIGRNFVAELLLRAQHVVEGLRDYLEGVAGL